MRRQEERKGGIKKQMGQIVNRDKDGRVKRGSHSGPVVPGEEMRFSWSRCAKGGGERTPCAIR